MKQTIILKGDWPAVNTSLNNAKRHWSLYAKEKRDWTHRVWAEAKAGKLRAHTPPVRLQFHWYMKDLRRDPDNLRGVATKYVLDGLVQAGVIPDDSPKYIAGFTDVFVLDRKNPRIEVTLETVDEV